MLNVIKESLVLLGPLSTQLPSYSRPDNVLMAKCISESGVAVDHLMDLSQMPMARNQRLWGGELRFRIQFPYPHQAATYTLSLLCVTTSFLQEPIDLDASVNTRDSTMQTTTTYTVGNSYFALHFPTQYPSVKYCIVNPGVRETCLQITF